MVVPGVSGIPMGSGVESPVTLGPTAMPRDTRRVVVTQARSTNELCSPELLALTSAAARARFS
jgi:hypothetical protein